MTNKKRYRCKYCKKEFFDWKNKKRIFCSHSCHSTVKNCKLKIKCKCHNCAKIYYVNPARVIKTKYCSKKCSCYFAGVAAAHISRKNNTGFFGISYKDRVKNGKISGKLAAITNKKNKTGFYDFRIRRLASNVMRQNIRNLKYQNQYYDSKQEIEISLCLKYQYNYKPIERKTLHVWLKGGEIDFLLCELKCFIELHPWDFCGKSHKQYYNKRRKILDTNDYKEYALVVIK